MFSDSKLITTNVLSPDYESEISLKISQFMMKLRRIKLSRTKRVPNFWTTMCSIKYYPIYYNHKKFIVYFCSTFLYRIQLNIQFYATSADFIQNIFLKHPFSAKSNDMYCLLLMGHDSRPYNNTCKHFKTFNSSTVTSSDAAPATFLNTALNAR